MSLYIYCVYGARMAGGMAAPHGGGHGGTACPVSERQGADVIAERHVLAGVHEGPC